MNVWPFFLSIVEAWLNDYFSQLTLYYWLEIRIFKKGKKNKYFFTNPKFDCNIQNICCQLWNDQFFIQRLHTKEKILNRM